MQGSNYILTKGLIAKLEELQGPSSQPLEPGNGVVLQRLFTVSILCNGSAIKGRDVSSVGSQRERFLH
jgi:hypothetical protein